MDIQQAHDLVHPFFFMREQEIFDKFTQLSDKSIFVNAKHPCHRSLFIPGTRKNKVLLVAHVDTVWKDNKNLKVEFGGEDFPMFFSGTREEEIDEDDEDGDVSVTGIGIGADDRAGIAALWHMRDLGHSMLLTAGEEEGCLGSRYLMSSKKMVAILQDHCFMVQFDRKGRNDLVFYNVGTKHFVKYMEQNAKGFAQNSGSFTDICVLCEKIPGVNVSIGYCHEHTVNEMLNLRYFMNTLDVFHNFLSRNNLEQFSL